MPVQIHKYGFFELWRHIRFNEVFRKFTQFTQVVFIPWFYWLGCDVTALFITWSVFWDKGLLRFWKSSNVRNTSALKPTSLSNIWHIAMTLCLSQFLIWTPHKLVRWITSLPSTQKVLSDICMNEFPLLRSDVITRQVALACCFDELPMIPVDDLAAAGSSLHCINTGTFVQHYGNCLAAVWLCKTFRCLFWISTGYVPIYWLTSVFSLTRRSGGRRLMGGVQYW